MNYQEYNFQRAWYNYALCVFCLVFCLAFSSCNETPASATKKGERLFFDIKDYFDKEATRLTGMPVKKIASVDGKREEQLPDSMDFTRDLKIFSENDINRPAWSDSYQTDSIFNDQKELTRLNYTAMDDKMKTRQILIDFDHGAVSKIHIENGTSSAVAHTRQVLIYEPQKGYSIESHQKVTLTDDNVFLVEVQFLKN